MMPVVQQEWLEQLQHCTTEDIRRGLGKWHEPWPPNVFEFALACAAPVSVTREILKAEKNRELPPPRYPKDKAITNLAQIRSMIFTKGLFQSDET